MTTTSRQPFSVRAGLVEPAVDEAPYEGVPPHLLGEMREWVSDSLERCNEEEADFLARTVCMKLRLTVNSRSASYRLAQSHGTELLDVVDEMLSMAATFPAFKVSVSMLTWMLNVAGSAYRVNDDEDGLETRIDPAVRVSVRQTVADAAAASTGSADAHLSSAWREVYGRNPDPGKAYSEAIKAVESAAHAAISPNNARATLGTMLRDLRAAPHNFTAAITAPAGGDPLVVVDAMMSALWQGQTSRHGAQTATVPETLEAARAGVHLAATLVQWFASGAVSRQP